MNVSREVPIFNTVIDEPGTQVVAETLGKECVSLKPLGEFGSDSNSG